MEKNWCQRETNCAHVWRVPDRLCMWREKEIIMNENVEIDWKYRLQSQPSPSNTDYISIF